MRLKIFLHKIRILNPAAAFLMTFCPLCYILLIASWLSRVFGEDLLVYPSVMAAFILAIGLGKTRRHGQNPGTSEEVRQKLIWLELGLTFTGFFSVLGIDALLFDSLSIINLEAGVYGLAVVGGIGFLSGQALTAFYHSCSS
ncbi:MAG: hypothetical protein WC450_01925, partial [Candidatus Omnitrophota bacterium]